MSLTDQAYDLIKRKIITTAYAPGASLNEQQICEDINIGRSPVHHAVHRLARDGFFEIVPRKRVIVKPVSLDEAAQLIEVRLINEPYAAELAAVRAMRSDIDFATKILEESARQIETSMDIETLMELDRKFHNWITSVAQNKILGDIIIQIHDRSARFWFLSLSDKAHASAVYEEHMEILQAIASKDPVRAANSIRAHIESFRNAILRVK